MKDKVRVGYIGLGLRGSSMLKKCFAEMNDVDLVALCDCDDAKLAEYSTYLEEKGKGKPFTTKDYNDFKKLII